MAKAEKKKKRALLVFVVIICLAVLGGLVVYYQYMKKQQQKTRVNTPATEVEKLIAKDLETGYPQTPKEVIKLFCRINQSVYNKELSDEEFSSLVEQLQALYCQELKKQNSVEKVEEELSKDADKYRKENKKIVNYTIEESDNFQYKTVQGKEMVYLKYSYFMREGSKYSTWNQSAILVREEDKWKIMGFGPGPFEKSEKIVD